MKKLLFGKLCKKSIATLMALLMFLSAAALTPALSVKAYADVFAQVEDPGATYKPGSYKTNPTGLSSSVNMYAQPNSMSLILQAIGKNVIVNVVEVSGKWGKTTYSGKTGWIDLDQTIPQDVDDSDSDSLYEPGYFGALDDTFLYEEKDIYSMVLAEIPAFEIIYVSHCSGDWGEVTYNGKFGWVNLNDFIEAPDTDYISDTDTTTDTSSPFKPGKYVVSAVSTSSIALYSQPNILSSILIQIPNFTELTVNEFSGVWGKTTYLGKTGWVQMSYLTQADDTDSESPYQPGMYGATDDTYLYEGKSLTSGILAEIPVFEEVKVTECSGNWGKTKYDGKTGWVNLTDFVEIPDFDTESEDDTESDTESDTETDISSPFKPGTYIVSVILQDSINLYSETNTYSTVLTTIPNYEFVDITECVGFWGKTTYKGHTGWVQMSSLTKATGSDVRPDYDTGTYKVNIPSGVLNLREEPKASSPALTTIPKDTYIVVTEFSVDWGKTTYDGFTGWVSMTYLEFISSDTDITTDSEPQYESGYYIVSVNGGQVAMREEPGQGEEIDYIPDETVLYISAFSAGWGKVVYNGYTGWVPMILLQVYVEDTESDIYETESDIPEEETFTVSTADGTPLPMYASNSSLDIILSYIPDGTTVILYMTLDNWLFVEYEGATGWIERYPGLDGNDDPKYGDLNNDGGVTMEDVVLYQKIVAKLLDFTVSSMLTADVDANTEYNMSDIVLIQRYIARLITEFPAESEDVTFG